MDVSSGTVRPLASYGDAVLHKACAPVEFFGAELQALVDDMFATMYEAGGVGLAANQIGVGLRVFVYDCPDASGENQAGHVVNPVLTESRALAPPLTGPEGCLSVPGQQADVTRAGVATVTGVDASGRPVAVSGTGLLARCLQHEVDHLRGTVYVDLLPPAERAAILAAAGRLAPGQHGPAGMGAEQAVQQPLALEDRPLHVPQSLDARPAPGAGFHQRDRLIRG